MEKVYPRLKEFCQQRGYEFQVVDMRWGVRDEATDDHMTSELCMRELAHCKKYSTGPNFIVSVADTAVPGLPFKLQNLKSHLTCIFITKLSLFALYWPFPLTSKTIPSHIKT